MSELQFLKEARLDGRVEWRVPMAEMTTLRVGGPADAVVFAASEEDVRTVARLCREHGAPLAVVGRGSNLLVRDGGLRGVVLCLGKDFARIAVRGGEIFAQAGAALGALALAARDAGLAGLEFAAGIPGSVGGAAAMNAGAYGGQMADVLTGVTVVTRTGETREAAAEELELGYRHSVLMKTGGVVTEARFRLTSDKREFIAARMEDYLSRRREKQPLEYPSAGSFFKRPPGHFAGTLIEACGLKGKRVGGAQVSEKHAGFLINTGGATCADILELSRQVREIVYERTGVRLEPEVRPIGRGIAGE